MTRYFGTDGARGRANQTLSVKTAYRIGRYLGQYPNGRKNRVLVCRDTRLSGPMFLNGIVSGLLASGADVYDEGVSTTPSISYLVEKHHFDFGVMISASHNPFYDNGIKVFNSIGEKLEGKIEDLIEDYIDRPADDLPFASDEKIGHYSAGDSLKDEYIAWLAEHAPKKTSNLRIVCDCANGSASYVAPKLFKKLGYDVTFINCQPDGLNINDHCGSTYLVSLEKALKEGNFDFGFAFDGDSDRFMAYEKNGRLLDGDVMIYLGAMHLKEKNLLHQNKVVVTVMSNYGLLKALEKSDISYEIVPVGDKNVQACLKEKGLSIGGEQSGHVIFLDDLNTGDGLLTALKLLCIYEETPKAYASLKNFESYPQVLENIRFPNREAVAKTLETAELKELMCEVSKDLDGEGRLLVRCSGTEPLIRVMAEALTIEKASLSVNKVADLIKKDL